MENPLFVALIGAVVGVFLTLLMQLILKKRGLFTYFVLHSRVGLSTEDEIFGKVRVTWNDNSVRNLFLSTIELRNESLNDYQDIVVRVIAMDTGLLTERAQILGTTHFLKWTEGFSKDLTVEPDHRATPRQIELYRKRREFQIPTMNRGQIVHFSFLNEALSDKEPRLWLEILHKNVRLEFRVRQQDFMGVPASSAARVGSVLGIAVFSVVIAYIKVIWITALICMIYGLMVRVPGALAIKSWRWFRDSIGN